MKKSRKEKIAAIVPARNEAKTIGNVLRVLFNSEYFDEIIVVDGASTDDTAVISESMGAKVIRSVRREGKGLAMKNGLESTDAEIIVFFDADLVGLAKNHIRQLIDPVANGKAVMCKGARSHWGGLPFIIASIDPLLSIGGERAMRRFVLENIPERFIKDFAIETALNYYCVVNKLPTVLVELKGLKLVPKERKWGVTVGLSERIKEALQLIKFRLIILFKRNEFVQKNNLR